MYFKKLNTVVPRYAENNPKPAREAVSANLLLIRLPTAAAMTDAFQVKINKAPVPYNKENIRQKNRD